MRNAPVKLRQKSRRTGRRRAVGRRWRLPAASALAPAQVSLTTVVEMAQQNSSCREARRGRRSKGAGRPRPDPRRLYPQLRHRLPDRLLSRLPHRPALGGERHHAVAGSQLFAAPVHQGRTGRRGGRQPEPQGCQGAGGSRRLHRLHRTGHREQRTRCCPPAGAGCRAIWCASSSSAPRPASIP